MKPDKRKCPAGRRGGKWKNKRYRQKEITLAAPCFQAKNCHGCHYFHIAFTSISISHERLKAAAGV